MKSRRKAVNQDEPAVGGDLVNKGGCCAYFGWTRYEFDQHVAAGMPYVEAAAHKGGEWLVDLAAVDAWLEERAAAERAYRRRQAEGRAARERERAAAERARLDTLREREERWHAELRARQRAGEELRLLGTAYLVCIDLARGDLGYRPSKAMPDEVKARFRADWPYERPSWWRPPPGMLDAVRASRDQAVADWPDWRRWWPEPYVPGRPWPWRAAEGEG